MGVFFSHPKKKRTFGSFIPYSLRISGQIAELVQSLFLGNIMSPHETVDVLSNLLVQVATASMFARQLFGYVFLQRTPQPVEALSAMCFHDSAGRFFGPLHFHMFHLVTLAFQNFASASARNISCVVPRCLQVQETSVA